MSYYVVFTLSQTFIRALFFLIPIAAVNSIAKRAGRPPLIHTGWSFLAIWIFLSVLQFVLGDKGLQTLRIISFFSALLGIVAWIIGVIILKAKQTEPVQGIKESVEKPAQPSTPDEELRSQGIIHLMKDDFTSAIDAFTKAIEINPDNAKAYHNRGVAYSRTGEFNRAIDDFDKVIRLNPDIAKQLGSFVQRGIVCEKMGNKEQAIDDEDDYDVIEDKPINSELSSRIAGLIDSLTYEMFSHRYAGIAMYENYTFCYTAIPKTKKIPEGPVIGGKVLSRIYLKEAKTTYELLKCYKETGEDPRNPECWFMTDLFTMEALNILLKRASK